MAHQTRFSELATGNCSEAMIILMLNVGDVTWLTRHALVSWQLATALRL